MTPGHAEHGGLGRFMPWTAGLMWVATLASPACRILRLLLQGRDSRQRLGAWAGGAFFYLLWAMGTAAALLTAFYMTRLMIYTFHGPNRTGEKEREHLHEAPWVMIGPLVVLGAGSCSRGC